MVFPSPVAFYIGTWPVYWYGIAYALGLTLAWKWGMFLIRKKAIPLTISNFSDFLLWIIAGILLGGRAGHVLLYAWEDYSACPEKILCVWEGGMAFHGAALGLAFALGLYSLKRKINMLTLADVWLCGAPIGIFLGRLANFINQELYGNPFSWGVVFPKVDALARHPSQIYEALTEGGLLFMILGYLSLKTRALKRPGLLTGIFLIGYAVTRFMCEYTKDLPETILSFSPFLTLGQVYNLPLILLGGFLIRHAYRRPYKADL